MAEVEAAGRVSRFSRTTTTVAELARWWLEHDAAHRLRPSSLAQMEARLAPSRLRELGAAIVGELHPEQIATWQSRLLTGEAVGDEPRRSPLAAKTVADVRTVLRQVLASAVDFGLLAANPVDRVKPPRSPRKARRVLDADGVHRLLDAADGYRYGTAVAILFVQGLRVSEVLGLAWSDVDLENGIVTVRRAVVEVAGKGRRLGPTKTAGAEGVHRLAPGIVERLRRQRVAQAAERLAAGPLWQSQSYEGVPVDLVFTREDGGLVARQQVAKAVQRAAEAAGLDPTGLGTHAGRRSVVTALYASGVSIEDVARHVGHSSSATTAGYVQSFGDRPERTAEVAARLLDTPLRVGE